jgi:hypothetical protein
MPSGYGKAKVLPIYEKGDRVLVKFLTGSARS